MATLKLKTKPAPTATPIVRAAVITRRREVPILCLPKTEVIPEPTPAPVKAKGVRKPKAPPKVKNPPMTAEDIAVAQANRQQRVSKIVDLLMNLWPDSFPDAEDDLRPWAIGLRQHVKTILNDDHATQCSGSDLNRAFAQYLAQGNRQVAYWTLLAAGGQRFYLDGQPAGAITEHEQKGAFALLERRENRKLLDV